MLIYKHIFVTPTHWGIKALTVVAQEVGVRAVN